MLVDLIIYLKRYPVLKAALLIGLSVILGAIGAFAMPPTNFWPLIFISLSGIYALYSYNQNAVQAFGIGFFFGIGYFVTGLWWIGNALLVEGNEFAWVWPLSVIGLPTLLSLFTGTAFACATIIARPHRLSGFFAFTGCLALSEWVRGHIFTGFPWNLFGYSWSDVLSIAQSASIIGAYGLTLLTIFWAAMIGFLWTAELKIKTKILIALITIATGALCFTYGTQRLNNNPTILRAETAVHIIQPNIPQADKWKSEFLVSNFEKHIALSTYQSETTLHEIRQAKSHIIVWPETAIAPVLAESQAAREQISRMLTGYPTKATLLSGALMRKWKGEEKEFTNSLVRLDHSGKLEALYHKSHLVPFGEYIPFQDLIPIKPVAQFQGFKRGNGPETFFGEHIPAFSPLICYEIIFPGKAVEPEMRPEWIVTVTNDAWYGDSAGPHQHFVHAIFRSIEEGVPVIRSANTGISGLTDSYGRVLERSSLNQDWKKSSLLPHPAEQSTIFSQFAHLPFFLLTLCFIGFSILFRRT